MSTLVSRQLVRGWDSAQSGASGFDVEASGRADMCYRISMWEHIMLEY